ncbi:hypothetical protein Tco_1333377 [Tanacetum coccineum]
MYCSMVSAIASASSSSEYSWSENKLKLGDLSSSRLSDLKCLLDDQNSRSSSSKLDTPYPMGVDTPYPMGVDTPYPMGVDTPYQEPKVSIEYGRIQCIGYSVLGVSWRRTQKIHNDIFQNIYILILNHRQLVSLDTAVLSFIVLYGSLVSSSTVYKP